MNDLEKALKEYRRLLEKVKKRPEHFDLTIKFFNSDGISAVSWLIKPARALAGKLPIECDYDDVRNVLKALEHGLFL